MLQLFDDLLQLRDCSSKLAVPAASDWVEPRHYRRLIAQPKHLSGRADTSQTAHSPARPAPRSRTSASISCAIFTPSPAPPSCQEPRGHPRHNRIRHAHPQIVLHELRIAQTRQRPDPRDHRNPETLNPPQKLLQHPQVEHRLRNRITPRPPPPCTQTAAPPGRYPARPDSPPPQIVNPVDPPIEFFPISSPWFRFAHDVHQPNRIHIEHRRRIRIVPQLRRIARQAQNILQPDRRRAQQIALNAQHIPVATGVVQHRLDPDLLLNLHAQTLRTHPRARPRRIRHIDRVNAARGQQRRARQAPCCSQSPSAAQSPPDAQTLPRRSGGQSSTAPPAAAAQPCSRLGRQLVSRAAVLHHRDARPASCACMRSESPSASRECARESSRSNRPPSSRPP